MRVSLIIVRFSISKAMLLYKYRSIQRIEHLLDILLNERLYCAEYFALNDPFEGQFRAIVPDLDFFYTLQPKRRTVPMDIANLPLEPTKVRVCSLSRDPSDVRLWSLYADGHKGVAIEIDFAGIEASLIEVKYRTPLPEFGTTILAGTSAEEVLGYKTDHWKYEQEYRVITDQPHVSIQGRVKRVVFGVRTPVEIADLLSKVRPKEIAYVHASLDHSGLLVRT